MLAWWGCFESNLENMLSVLCNLQAGLGCPGVWGLLGKGRYLETYQQMNYKYMDPGYSWPGRGWISGPPKAGKVFFQ